MKNYTKMGNLTMKLLGVFLLFAGGLIQAYAHTDHPMQHGFILTMDDTFASHLVASGSHSRQVEITGQLTIPNEQEMETYRQRKLQNSGFSYFLFQAQNLDLSTLSADQVLTGHIVESKIGNYEPQNIVVRSATFKIQNILLNIINPFFNSESQTSSVYYSNGVLQQEGVYLKSLLNNTRTEKKHCCETGEKPCNWKC